MVELRSNRSLSSTKHRPLRHWSAPSLIGAKGLSPHAAVSSGQGKKMPWWNQAGTQRNLVTVWPLSLQAQNDKETFDSQLWFSLVQCWFIGLGFSLIKNWKQINLLLTGCWIVAAIVIGFTHLLAAQTREKCCFFCGLWQWVWIAPHSLTHSFTHSLTDSLIQVQASHHEFLRSSIDNWHNFPVMGLTLRPGQQSSHPLCQFSSSELSCFCTRVVLDDLMFECGVWWKSLGSVCAVGTWHCWLRSQLFHNLWRWPRLLVFMCWCVGVCFALYFYLLEITCNSNIIVFQKIDVRG